MIIRNVIVYSSSGLHLRPAGRLSKEACRYRSEIYLRSRGQTVTAKSVLAIMTAGIRQGEQIELLCDGEDEAAAAEAVGNLIERGLEEEPAARKRTEFI